MEWIVFVILGVIAFFIITYLLVIVFGFKRIADRVDDIIYPYEARAIPLRDEKLLSDMKEEYAILSKYMCTEIDINSCLDNTRLHGYYYRREKAKGTAILFHGYKSNPYLDVTLFAGFIIEKGFDVLLISHRAHGKSEGKNICFGIKEKYDCKSWCDYVSEQKKDLPIILEGISMGGATVAYASNLNLPSNVKMIIEDCGFTNPYTEIGFIIKKMKLPSSIIMPGINLMYKIKENINLKSNDVRDALSKTSIPVLFLHGKNDEIVPYEMGCANYNACASEKELISVDGAGHGYSYPYAKEKCIETINKWIEKYIDNP